MSSTEEHSPSSGLDSRFALVDILNVPPTDKHESVRNPSESVKIQPDLVFDPSRRPVVKRIKRESKVGLCASCHDQTGQTSWVYPQINKCL